MSLGQPISAPQFARYADTGARQVPALLSLPPPSIDELRRRRPFVVSHSLADEDRLSLPALFALCRRLPKAQMQFRVGEVPGDADFDEAYWRYRSGLRLDDVLTRFEASRAYLCVYNPERDAGFRPLTDRLLADVSAACAALGERITWYSTYVFVSTDASMTPYHMDRELNFLLQVRGTKEVCLWDPDDPSVLSAEQKEALLAYDGPRPAYDPAIEPKSRHYALSAGLGVHHPFLAPHRVRTTSALSVSLAFTFRTDRTDRTAAVHRFNHGLRRLGVRPAPCGRHPAIDAVKAGSLDALRHGRRLADAARASWRH